MALLELATRAEQAGADKQREMLLLAWNATLGASDKPEWWDLRDGIEVLVPHSLHEIWRSFEAKLDAEAYLDAAMMLMPEGWNAQIGLLPARSRYWVELAKPEHDPLLVGKYFGRTNSTLALALVAAVLRAIAKQATPGSGAPEPSSNP